MEIRLQLLLSIIATGVLLAISGFLLSRQISEVGQSFDEVQNQATPSIIALGNLKADFNHLVATILAYAVHASDEHREDVHLAREQLLLSYEEYAAVEGDPAAAETIGNEIDALLVIGDDMMAAAEAAAGIGPAHADEDHMAADGTMADHDAAAMAGETHADNMAGSAASPDSAAAGNAGAAGDTGEFSEGVLMLHEVLQEFDLQAANVNTEIEARIEDNFADMQAKQNVVLADIGTGANLNLLLTVAVLGVTAGIGGVVALSISRRVIQLKKTAGEIAEGNLGKHIATQGADEIAALAASFEQMRKSLVEVQEELKSRNIDLNELNIALENANEELKQLDKLKDEFISVASHELRSPIHPILGYASMARDGMISEKEALDVIYKQAVRLRQLANDILDVSRIESGTLPYSMKELSIHEVLANCVEAIKPSVGAEVSVVTDFDSHDIEMIGDKERLTQVFTNLLGNALKFTKKGRIAVETRLAGPDSIVVKISDTGGGIPKEILPRLFNKFVTKKVGEDEAHGTGLGLFISRSIVEAHGGKISAYNNDTGGATFRIELPLRAGGQGKKQTPIAVSAEHPREAK
ncbi:MAG: HAMP domain-containing sensor histidine kinase [Nitrososphaera sp.]|uniref:sensor histidine kinase n=1 Tax=Nitrososphaera sp. TaxID=1971748 RepID=UPI00316D3153